MEVIFTKSKGNEEVLLAKMIYGDIDFRFIRRNDDNQELINIPIQLSIYNKNAQTQINEMFEIYKIDKELMFDITDVLKGFPSIKRH